MTVRLDGSGGITAGSRRLHDAPDVETSRGGYLVRPTPRVAETVADGVAETVAEKPGS